MSTLHVNNTPGDTNKPVVVGIDGSSEAQAALHEAIVLAQALGRRLEAVTVWQYSTSMYDAYHPEPGASPKIRALETAHAAASKEFGEHWPAWFSIRAEVGNPGETLVEASENASHLVVGSRGRGGLTSAFLGSVSLHCASHARCPVVVVGSAARPPVDLPTHSKENQT